MSNSDESISLMNESNKQTEKPDEAMIKIGDENDCSVLPTSKTSKNVVSSVEPTYIKVIDEENDEPIEIPIENDGLLMLSTLAAQFPGASGIKFRSSSGAFRGLRLDDGGKIHPPHGEDGWSDRTYVAVFPKENTKRKMDDHVDASGATKLKKLERKKCSDLIVLGLPYKTTEDEVREYFEQFGEVLVAQVKKDARTNRSKGFGFIRFADYDSQVTALSQKHNIDGRWCDVKIPNSRSDTANPVDRKIFVGRINESVTVDDLREHFVQFGDVIDVFIPKPFRGFGFVTFSEPEIAASLCGEDYIVKGCSIHVSQAVPKDHPPYGGHNNGNSPMDSNSRLGSRGGGNVYGRNNVFSPDGGSSSRYSGGRSLAEPYHRRWDSLGPIDDYFSPSAAGGGGGRYYANDRGDTRNSPFAYDQSPHANKVWNYPPYNASYNVTPSGNSAVNPAAFSPPWTGGVGGCCPPSALQRNMTPTPQQHQQIYAPPGSNQAGYAAATQPAAAVQSAITGYSNNHQNSAETNQATASMGALNLNSLINPSMLAAAQALIAAATGAATGGSASDFTKLISSFQMTQNAANGNANGQQVGGAQQTSSTSASSSTANWWPSLGSGANNSTADPNNQNAATSRKSNVAQPTSSSPSTSAAGAYRTESWR